MNPIRLLLTFATLFTCTALIAQTAPVSAVHPSLTDPVITSETIVGTVEPSVTLALSIKDGKLTVCKQSPWSKQDCVKFKKSPPAEAASISKWLHRNDNASVGK